MDGSRRAYVLLGDLIASRDAPQRQALAGRARRALEDQTAAPWREEWLAAPVFTKGIDEFSGVLRRPRHAFDVAVALNGAIWPQRFRFALAEGEIDIGWDTGVASQMDGPAFHLAAAALERARADRLAVALALPDREPAGCALLEATASLHAAIMASWSPRAHEIVSAYRRTGSQAAAAVALSISQQAVSAAMRRAMARELLAAERTVRAWLQPAAEAPDGA